MEKRTPHCPLERIRALLSAGRVNPTTASLRGAQALGVEFADMLQVIAGLERRDFYKACLVMSIIAFGKMSTGRLRRKATCT